MAKKITWTSIDVAASTHINRMIEELDVSNRHLAEMLHDRVQYNRIRDIRKMLRAPIRLSEFVAICKACGKDPERELGEIIVDAHSSDHNLSDDDRIALTQQLISEAYGVAAYESDNKDHYTHKDDAWWTE